MRVTPRSPGGRFAVVSEGPLSLAIEGARNQPSLVGHAYRGSSEGWVWETKSAAFSGSYEFEIDPTHE